MKKKKKKVKKNGEGKYDKKRQETNRYFGREKSGEERRMNFVSTHERWVASKLFAE